MGLLSYFVLATGMGALHRIRIVTDQGGNDMFQHCALFRVANAMDTLNQGAFFLLVWLVQLFAAHRLLAGLAGEQA